MTITFIYIILHFLIFKTIEKLFIMYIDYNIIISINKIQNIQRKTTIIELVPKRKHKSNLKGYSFIPEQNKFVSIISNRNKFCGFFAKIFESNVCFYNAFY